MSVDGGTICNSNVLIHAGQVEMEQECRGKVPGCYQVGRWNGCGMLWDLNKLFRGKRLIVLCTSKTRYRIDRRSVWRIWVLGKGGCCAGKETCAVGEKTRLGGGTFGAGGKFGILVLEEEKFAGQKSLLW